MKPTCKIQVPTIPMLAANATAEDVDAVFGIGTEASAAVKRFLGIRPRTSPIYEASVAYHLESLPNGRGHWRKERVVTSRHKELATTAALQATKSTVKIRKMAASSDTIHVHFVRIAPKLLDSDNNVGAFKFWRDTIAKMFGINDGNEERWRWTYAQAKGKHEVRVRIWTEEAS